MREVLVGAQAPLYRSIAGLLRTDIGSGKLAPGERIPTIDKLARSFGVARVTVRQALAVLIDEGLVFSRQGRGTFVASDPRKPRVVRLESSWQQLLHMLEGNDPEMLALQESVDAAPIQPEDGDPAPAYRYMRRLHRCDGVPYCVIEIYLARAVYNTNPDGFDSNMVIALLQQVPGLRLRRMRQSLHIGRADLDTARLLGVEANAPIGIVRRVITDSDGRVVYVGIGRYRGDLVVFDTAINLPG
ncbi:MAG: GntR family transcriptional regulator [Proteobacteria bacterium]|nr:GntR family transcriptional regulator [Pseudomonadota bacterium]